MCSAGVSLMLFVVKRFNYSQQNVHSECVHTKRFNLRARTYRRDGRLQCMQTTDVTDSFNATVSEEFRESKT